MEQSLEVGTTPSTLSTTDDPARRPLIALSILTFIATVTGTFIYAYPTTLRSVRSAMVLLHDVSGDLMLVTGAWYLWLHLPRTWRMKRRVLQRWSGYLSVAVWSVAAATGIYGQVADMPSGSTFSVVHAISAIALLVIACFHGGYGLRRYFR